MGWLHDGHRALIAPGPRRERDGRGHDLRQPAPVRRGDRLHAATHATRPATSRSARRTASTSSGRRRVEEVYPPGFDTASRSGPSREPLEGAARPGHFEGVATVVAILFGLVGAERAYFGQKDAQQVDGHPADGPRPRAVGTAVIACPTVREPDGLALSSRNVHLSPGRAGRGPGPPPRAARRPATRWTAGERSGRRAARRDARGPRERAARGRRVRLGGRRRRPSPSSTRSTARRCSRSRSGSAATRLIDNEPC